MSPALSRATSRAADADVAVQAAESGAAEAFEELALSESPPPTGITPRHTRSASAGGVATCRTTCRCMFTTGTSWDFAGTLLRASSTAAAQSDSSQTLQAQVAALQAEVAAGERALAAERRAAAEARRQADDGTLY